jgi:hypothetical protein
MLLLRLNLRIPISGHTRDSTTNGAHDTVCGTTAEIAELPLGFLGFAFGVLFLALLLQVLYKQSASIHYNIKSARNEEGTNLRSNESTNGFLCGANGLVPASIGAVGVVLCDGSRRRSSIRAELCGRVRCFVLELSLVFLGLASVLFHY